MSIKERLKLYNKIIKGLESDKRLAYKFYIRKYT
jgi:hypothetical protein